MNFVQYIDLGGVLVIGQPTIVMPYDHPNESINRQWVRTSPVVRIDPGITGPVFVTKNTVYRPLDGIKPLPVGKVQYRDYTKTPFGTSEVHV